MLTAVSPKSGKISKIERKDDALYLYSEAGMTVLKPMSANIVRVVKTVKDVLSDKEKPGVINRSSYADWSYVESDDFIELKLEKLIVSVFRKTGAIAYYDPEKSLLTGGSDAGNRTVPIFAESPENSVEFEEFETFRLSDEPAKTEKIKTADGEKEVIREASKISTGKSYHIRFHFALGDEALYGLGQQEKGFGSLRGHTLYIRQGNRKIAVPMFVSTNGYGLLTDTYSPMIFNDNSDGTYLYIEADAELDYYFICGGMNSVVKGYRYLTGKASMLPKWAYGYVQSKERYESADELIAATEKSRSLGIGMDCIVLDWISWPDNEWGQKSYDEKRFPDPVGMIDKLHADHTHFMISLWPTMAENTPDHREFAAQDLFLPACSVYNAFKKEARELYFDQLKRTHFSYGTDAWWCDSSEPFTPEWNHAMRHEESVLFTDYLNETGLRMPYEYSNAFPLYHAMGIYENQRAAMKDPGYKGGDKRVVNLTRSAYTGQQRYGTIMWSGDTDASWETLKDQVAIGLHFSASGLPYWTMDIGAFFVKNGNYWYWKGKYDDTFDNKGYCELYTRWYQFAAFLPMFRAHGTDCDRELWMLKGEFYDACLKANRLRYRLMPYIYSEAGKVWLKDRSLIRFLSFDFTNDKATWDITDQYMFGESLMVCPVLTPMYYDESGDPLDRGGCGNAAGTKANAAGTDIATAGVPKARKVYFPKGCDWYDIETGEKYAGGSTVMISAPLDKIPVFAREGSVIPVTEPALSTEEQTGPVTYLRFPKTYRGYEMYTDAGDGYAYENGEYKLEIV